jgi:hypothetical protein
MLLPGCKYDLENEMKVGRSGKGRNESRFAPGQGQGVGRADQGKRAAQSVHYRLAKLKLHPLLIPNEQNLEST